MRPLGAMCSLLIFVLCCGTNVIFASAIETKKQSELNKTWIFKSLSRTNDNQLDANKLYPCPDSSFFTEHFDPIYSFKTQNSLFDFKIYELHFDLYGNVIDPKTKSVTDWHGEYKIGENGIAKITLAKKGCTEVVDFGYYNPKTQRLCRVPEETFLSHKKNPDFIDDLDSCTEWAKVLASPRKKVIDVTTYDNGEFGVLPGSFMGFLRFKDKPKPVVSHDDNIEHCFLNCPSGKPGIINKP